MITVLFTEKSSIYDTLGCDTYDIQRNALTYPGGAASIYHPPCRSWSKLRAFAKPLPGESNLALWSIAKIRLYGGVMEHPATSAIWKLLPRPGTVDEYGGFTLFLNQCWFGHPAQKATGLYIVGCAPSEIPDYCPDFKPHVFSLGGTRLTKDLPKKLRSHTPERFATWLMQLTHTINQRRYS